MGCLSWLGGCMDLCRKRPVTPSPHRPDRADVWIRLLWPAAIRAQHGTARGFGLLSWVLVDAVCAHRHTYLQERADPRIRCVRHFWLCAHHDRRRYVFAAPPY